ncbi:MAG: hypothetical protein IIY78_03055 [Clostridia bacterium]|nr:hypothetical protein [Clostridia bacterium]MBQ4018922.1 hypothetical protein [Paludibacteraceae bacterium]
MTSWQEKQRLKLLEERRKEHEQYAAERLAKVNAICKLAWLNGMSYGQYIAERSKNMSDTPNVTPTAENTPTDTPTKRGIREPLPPEKVEKVREMLAEGAKISTIIAETLVSRATIDRIKSGTYGVKQPKKPPKAAEPAAITTPEVSKTSTTGFLRELISRAVETLRDAQGDTPDDCALVGKALGLLTAAELILGDNAK